MNATSLTPRLAPDLGIDGSENRLVVRLGATLTAVFCLAFTLLYWNRFVGVSSSGTFVFAAEQLLHGRMPYRDYFFIVPPLSILKIALLIQLAGDTLLKLRIEAVLERVFLAVLVYLWLARYFRATACLLGVLVAFILFASDPADALVSYHHDSVLWAVCAGFCASLFLKAASLGSNGTVAAVLSGLFAGLCFMTKQTTGAAITVLLPIVVTMLQSWSNRRKRAVQFVAFFSAGWLLSVGPIVLWLFSENALHSFFNCVFVNASSKGSPELVFLRPFRDRLGWVAATGLGLMAWWWNELPKGQIRIVQGSSLRLIGILGLSCLTLITCWYAGVHDYGILVLNGLVGLTLMAATMSGSVLLFLGSSWLFFHRRDESFFEQLVILSGVSLATAYALSMSFAYYGPMVMPGLALLIAMILDRLGGGSARKSMAITVVFAALIFVPVSVKLGHPFAWMQWAEGPVQSANYRSGLPELAGLVVGEDTGKLVDHITATVQAHMPAGGTLYVYPYYPLFYVLTGFGPPTYSLNHYVDVAPDAVCERDAQILLSNSPDVIVRLMEREPTIHGDESYYRGGPAHGVRKIRAALDHLAQTYRLLETVSVPGGERLQILVRH